MKDDYTPEMLCTGLPEEFVNYMNYVRRLEFEETPDYTYIRSLFINLLIRLG